MQQYMETLLKKIDYSIDKYANFENATVDKIVGNHDKTKYIFYITIDKMLNTQDYFEFISLVEKSYQEFSSIEVIFNVLNKSNNDIKDYYKFFIKQISKSSPLIENLASLNINIIDGKVFIDTINLAQKLRLEDILDKLKLLYRKIGYDNLKFQVNVTDSDEIQKEIANDLKIEVPKELLEKKFEPIHEEKKKWIPDKNYKRPPLIVEADNPEIVFGKKIEDKAVRLDTVASTGVTIIEAEVFGKDVISTKTGLKIITLKLTDYTDSIYAKIFVNDENEFNIIDKALKVGNWYKIKGSVKNDDYSKELTLSATDINNFKVEKQELVDDAPIKRVELHAHTMMSQMDGVTKLDLGKHTCELVEKTIKMGYRGVAITDHNGCQAFPISFGIIKANNKRLKN